MTTPHVPRSPEVITSLLAEPHDETPFAPDPVQVGGTVHVGHAIDSQAQAADFGAYMTYLTPAGTDQARSILPFDSNRHKALITVSWVTTPTLTTPYLTAGVWIGTQAQCQATPPVGGFLPVGMNNFPVENDQAVWLIGDGINQLRVTVAVERWS